MKRKINPQTFSDATKVIVSVIILCLICKGCHETTTEIPITLNLSKNSLYFSSSGGRDSFSITSNTNSWKVSSSSSSGLSISPESGSYNGLVTITAEPNTRTTSRTPIIIVNGTGLLHPDTIQVTIAAPSPSLNSSPDNLNFTATDSPKTLTVTSNTSWTVATNEDWLIVSPKSGSNNGTVTVAAEQNTYPSQRQAIITFTNAGVSLHTVNVIQQAGMTQSLNVSTTSMSFEAVESSKTFTITSNINWTVVSSEPAWLKVLPTSGSNNSTVTVAVENNINISSRLATITVSGSGISRIIAVTQSGAVTVDEPEMIFVHGGTFDMGCTWPQDPDCDAKNEFPSHPVTLNDFYISKFVVTQALWFKVMGTTVSQQSEKVNPKGTLRGEGDDYPMYYVSWDEVQEFINRLNTATGKNYRLPTEAEWEYAARDGINSNNCKWSGSNTIGEVAVYELSPNSNMQPVGTKNPNELKIYDMSGNIWEWCNDRYGQLYYEKRERDNPIGPLSGNHRVTRGGCWYSKAKDTRVSARSSQSQSARFNYIGFRLVRIGT